MTRWVQEFLVPSGFSLGEAMKELLAKAVLTLYAYFGYLFYPSAVPGDFNDFDEVS